VAHSRWLSSRAQSRIKIFSGEPTSSFVYQVSLSDRDTWRDSSTAVFGGCLCGVVIGVDLDRSACSLFLRFLQFLVNRLKRCRISSEDLTGGTVCIFLLAPAVVREQGAGKQLKPAMS
jgi:hypothetical protein